MAYKVTELFPHRSSGSSGLNTLRNYSELWWDLSRLSTNMLSKAVYWWKDCFIFERESSYSTVGRNSDPQKCCSTLWPSVFSLQHKNYTRFIIYTHLHALILTMLRVRDCLSCKFMVELQYLLPPTLNGSDTFCLYVCGVWISSCPDVTYSDSRQGAFTNHTQAYCQASPWQALYW